MMAWKAFTDLLPNEAVCHYEVAWAVSNGLLRWVDEFNPPSLDNGYCYTGNDFTTHIRNNGAVPSALATQLMSRGEMETYGTVADPVVTNVVAYRTQGDPSTETAVTWANPANNGAKDLQRNIDGGAWGTIATGISAGDTLFVDTESKTRDRTYGYRLRITSYETWSTPGYVYIPIEID
jgi:hypothetical protein